MSAWRPNIQAPFFKPTVALALGIVLAYLTEASLVFWAVALLFLSASFLYFYLRKQWQKPNFLGNAYLLGLFVLLGYCCFGLRYAPVQPNFWAKHRVAEIKSLFGEVTDGPFLKGGLLRYTLKIKSVHLIKGESVSASGHIRWVVQSSAQNFQPPQKGDLIELFKPPNAWGISSGDSTKEKPYMAFLGRRNIHGYLSSTAYDWALVKKAEPNPFTLWQTQLQEKVKIIPDSESKAMVSSLLFGNAQDIPSETFTAFKNTGTLHVLAVSGMHLWLVMGVITFLIKPVKHQKLLYLSIILMGVFAYLMLTDFSGSITRAALMFLIWWAAQFLGRPQSRINALCAAIFLMLCLNPFWIFDLGFQLSITAVLGILLWGPWINQHFRLTNYWGREALSAITGTLAATFFTAPVLAFHFQALPFWFLPANLLLIPLTSVSLFLGLLFLLTPLSLPGVPQILAWLISLILNWAATIAKTISQWPLALIEFANYQWIELVFFYAFLFYLYKCASEAYKPYIYSTIQWLIACCLLRAFSIILAII